MIFSFQLDHHAWWSKSKGLRVDSTFLDAFVDDIFESSGYLESQSTYIICCYHLLGFSVAFHLEVILSCQYSKLTPHSNVEQYWEFRVSKPNQGQNRIITQKNQKCKLQYFSKIMVCSFLQEIQPKNGQNCLIWQKNLSLVAWIC